MFVSLLYSFGIWDLVDHPFVFHITWGDQIGLFFIQNCKNVSDKIFFAKKATNAKKILKLGTSPKALSMFLYKHNKRERKLFSNTLFIIPNKCTALIFLSQCTSAGSFLYKEESVCKKDAKFSVS